MRPPLPVAGETSSLRGLFGSRDFRRLVVLRIGAQWGDGMFQAALGGAVLFNPERQADPLAVAAGLAVLLLPYSMIGPFVGALLDRWDRRRVLVVANALRGVLVLLVAALIGTGVAGVPLYLGALAVAGASRFVLAGLSAALPDLVARPDLVKANVAAATAGSAMTAIGAACAIGLRGLIGAGDSGSSIVAALAVLGSLVALVAAAAFRPGRLGPRSIDEPRHTMAAVARGLGDGAKAVARVPTVAASFLALATHRLAFGLTTLVTLLLFRYAFTDDGVLRAGLAGIGEAILVAAIGLGVAALLTPWLVHRLGRSNTVRVALAVAVTGQLGLAAFITLQTVLIAAFVLPTAGQIIKLCTDAAVQSEIADERRGRVFALYDAVFNVAFVLAVAAAAMLSSPDGRSPLLMVLAAAVYVIGFVGHESQLRRRVVPSSGSRLEPVLGGPPA